MVRYVSIRYAGSELTTDNEINGLTLGAVGRGTTLEYVEVFTNSDDCFEFFGGTVNASTSSAPSAATTTSTRTPATRQATSIVFSPRTRPTTDSTVHEGDAPPRRQDATPLSSPVVVNLTRRRLRPRRRRRIRRRGPRSRFRQHGRVHLNRLDPASRPTAAHDRRADGPTSPAPTGPRAPSGTSSTASSTSATTSSSTFSAGNNAAGVVRRDVAHLETAIANRNRFVSPGLVYVLDGPNAGDDSRDRRRAGPAPRHVGDAATGGSSPWTSSPTTRSSRPALPRRLRAGPDPSGRAAGRR